MQFTSFTLIFSLFFTRAVLAAPEVKGDVCALAMAELASLQIEIDRAEILPDGQLKRQVLQRQFEMKLAEMAGNNLSRNVIEERLLKEIKRRSGIQRSGEILQKSVKAEELKELGPIPQREFDPQPISVKSSQQIMPFDTGVGIQRLGNLLAQYDVFGRVSVIDLSIQKEILAQEVEDLVSFQLFDGGRQAVFLKRNGDIGTLPIDQSIGVQKFNVLGNVSEHFSGFYKLEGVKFAPDMSFALVGYLKYMQNSSAAHYVARVDMKSPSEVSKFVWEKPLYWQDLWTELSSDMHWGSVDLKTTNPMLLDLRSGEVVIHIEQPKHFLSSETQFSADGKFSAFLLRKNKGTGSIAISSKKTKVGSVELNDDSPHSVVLVIDHQTKKVIYQMILENTDSSVRFSKNSEALAIYTEGGIKILDLKTMNLMKIFAVDRQPLVLLSVDGEAKHIVAINPDSRRGNKLLVVDFNGFVHGSVPVGAMTRTIIPDPEGETFAQYDFANRGSVEIFQKYPQGNAVP